MYDIIDMINCYSAVNNIILQNSSYKCNLHTKFMIGLHGKSRSQASKCQIYILLYFKKTSINRQNLRAVMDF